MNPIMYAIVGTIAVIGLLMVLFLGGGTANPKSVTPEKANTLASSILADFSKVRDSVNAMQISGIASDDVVFNGTPPYSANNPSAVDESTPATAITQVFSHNYGRLGAVTPTDEIFRSGVSSAQRVYLYRRMVVSDGTTNVGTTSADILMMAVGIVLDVCQQVNRTTGATAINATPTALSVTTATITSGSTPQLSNSSNKAGQTVAGTFTVPSLNGSPRSTGCVIDSGATDYIAYQVLVSN